VHDFLVGNTLRMLGQIVTTRIAFARNIAELESGGIGDDVFDSARSIAPWFLVIGYRCAFG